MASVAVSISGGIRKPYSRVNANAPNRLETVAYIGAVRNAADTWYSGWTCNANYVSFGNASGACTAVPTS